VVVRTTAGKEFSAYLEYPKGDPREPMTEDDLDVKFTGLSEKLLNAERRKQVKDAVFNCEKLSAAEFMKTTVV
jgi:2-methylcitrate dehydratase